MNLDDIDIQILEVLQDDAKINMKDLVGKLHLTKTPVYERVRRLEKSGILGKYVALVNRSKLDTHMTVFCSVSLDMQKAENLKYFDQAIQELEEVVECYLTGGISDYMLKVVVKDLKEYHSFASGKLALLPHVTQIKSTFVLNEVKYQTKVPSSLFGG